MFLVIQAAILSLFSMDNIIIAQVLSPSHVSEFSVTIKLCSVVFLIFGVGFAPVWPALGEAMARGDTAWVTRTVTRTLMLAAIIAICAAGLVYGCGVGVICSWTSGVIVPSQRLITSVAILIVVGGVAGVWQIILNGMGCVAFHAKCSVILLPVAIVSKMWLIHHCGVAGVALGSAIAYVICILIPGAWIFWNMESEQRRMRESRVSGGDTSVTEA